MPCCRYRCEPAYSRAPTVHFLELRPRVPMLWDMDFDSLFSALELDELLTLPLAVMERLLSERKTAVGKPQQDRTDTPKKFQVSLEVKDYKPEELTVKTVDNCVVIEGKHEENTNCDFTSRRFTRRFQLPETVNPETVISSLSHDGILRVEAPLPLPAAEKEEEQASTQRTVPITQIGEQTANEQSPESLHSSESDRDAESAETEAAEA